MSISNESFLDKVNYCYVCGAKLDNKKLKSIIDEAATNYYRSYMRPIDLNDPVILSEDIQFCNQFHYWAYIEKKEEENEINDK